MFLFSFVLLLSTLPRAFDKHIGCAKIMVGTSFPVFPEKELNLRSASVPRACDCSRVVCL